MKKVYIIYRKMFEANGQMNVVGGIENYILSLLEIFQAQNWKVEVIQPAERCFRLQLSNCTVNGVDTGIYRGNAKKYALAKWVKKHASAQDIIIFATDSYSVELPGLKTIAIQHGISWDKPRSSSRSLVQLVSSLSNHIKYLGFAKKSPNLVCVDHNFVNWYRTWLNVGEQNIKVIYNFFDDKIDLASFDQKWQEGQRLKIIIARRFVDYRGIKFIAPIIVNIIQDYPDIEVTFAGDGPLKSYLEYVFKDFPQVTITQYAPNESFSIHKAHHIAIIPTLGSEGTSLSLIEAMAAGCLVISSNVGGLSNLVINGHNGHLLMPNAQEMKHAIHDALSCHSSSKQLALNGLQSIEQVCSKAYWGQEWIRFINRI